MTNLKNKIPIKGYATFDPLKHCLIGSGFKTEWFSDLSIYKNDKIIADKATTKTGVKEAMLCASASVKYLKDKIKQPDSIIDKTLRKS